MNVIIEPINIRHSDAKYLNDLIVIVKLMLFIYSIHMTPRQSLRPLNCLFNHP